MRCGKCDGCGQLAPDGTPWAWKELHNGDEPVTCPDCNGTGVLL